MKEAAIILAAGEGSRLGGNIPKQFLEVNGIPLLWYSALTFYAYNPEIQLIFVLPEKHMAHWKNTAVQIRNTIPHTCVKGGKTRAESVLSGLKSIDSSDLVFIHDAARPFASADLIHRLKSAALTHGNAIPFVDTVEERKEEDALRNKIIDRNGLKIIQTPQCFNFDDIMHAYEQNMFDDAKDDSEIFEAGGKEICLVEGEAENIKITYSADLDLLGLTLQQ